MKKPVKLRPKIVVGILVLFMAGCAAIPPEAPELSAELGNRINSIRGANLTLLYRFFDLKRADIDHFIQSEWAPTFADEVFSAPKMRKAWNTIFKKNSAEDRLKFLVIAGTKLQEQINQKRIELISPLDDLERRIEQEIRYQYAQAKSINNSITSFLLSASKMAENRDRYLDKTGLRDEKVGRAIDKLNDAVKDLLSLGNKTESKITKAEAYLIKLREIRDCLKANNKEG